MPLIDDEQTLASKDRIKLRPKNRRKPTLHKGAVFSSDAAPADITSDTAPADITSDTAFADITSDAAPADITLETKISSPAIPVEKAADAVTRPVVATPVKNPNFLDELHKTLAAKRPGSTPKQATTSNDTLKKSTLPLAQEKRVNNSHIVKSDEVQQLTSQLTNVRPFLHSFSNSRVCQALTAIALVLSVLAFRYLQATQATDGVNTEDYASKMTL